MDFHAKYIMAQVCAILDNDTYTLLTEEAKKRNVKNGRALALITKEYFADSTSESKAVQLLEECNRLQQDTMRKEKDILKLQNILTLKDEIIKLRDMQIGELQTNLNYLRHENSILVARIPVAVPRTKPLLTRIIERFKRASYTGG